MDTLTELGVHGCPKSRPSFGGRSNFAYKRARGESRRRLALIKEMVLVERVW